jgi:hypothetical protein
MWMFNEFTVLFYSLKYKKQGNQLVANKFSSPFIAELKPSKKVQHLLIAIHAIALGACFANALPLPFKLITALLIAFNFKITFPAFKTENRKISYSEKLGWQITKDIDFESVEILKSTVITTFFIFLHLRNQPALIIANDALDEDAYRELIVRLKITAN